MRAKKLNTLSLLVICILSITIQGCGGSGAGPIEVPPGVSPNQVTSIKLMPDRNVAQAGSFAYFHARVLDGNGMPVAGKIVNFTALSAGMTISSPTAVTDRDGLAKVSVRMTSPGYATVIAEIEGVRDKRSLFFTDRNTTRGLASNPIVVLFDVDRNNNGRYNEIEDFRICQGPNTNVVKLKVTTNVVGVKTGNIRVGLSADYPTLVTFPTTPFLDPATNTYYLTTNSLGEATVDITINCQIQPNETLLNIFAVTDRYYVEDYDGYFSGNGGVSLFLQPVTVTNLSISVDPQTVTTGGTSNIRVTVDTSAGIVGDNTAVQLYASCGTVSPTPATTINGVADAVFTAPAYVPAGGVCSVVAKVGGRSVTGNIKITGALEVNPLTVSIDGNTGGTVVFTVSGGTPPYRIYTNNVAFVPSSAVLWNSGDSFTVNVPQGTLPQEVRFTVRDYQSASVTATLQIIAQQGGVTQLAVFPENASIGAGETANFIITGGRPPYTVISTRPTIAFNGTSGNGTWTVSNSGGTFTVTGGVVNNNTAVPFLISDSLGNTINNPTVTVTASGGVTFDISPKNISLTGTPDTSDQITFRISGGTGPFTAITSNAIVIPPPTVSGRTFTINPTPVGTSTTVTLTVVDNSNNTTTSTNVTVTPATTSLDINPSSIEIAQGTNVTFYIIGGVGPFTVVSGDKDIVELNDDSSKVDLPSGTRQFIVKAKKNSGKAVITVIDNTGGSSATSNITVN